MDYILYFHHVLQHVQVIMVFGLAWTGLQWLFSVHLHLACACCPGSTAWAVGCWLECAKTVLSVGACRGDLQV